jgi:hypothetical protein
MTRPTDQEIATLLKELANSAAGLSYECWGFEASKQYGLAKSAREMAKQLEIENDKTN